MAVLAAAAGLPVLPADRAAAQPPRTEPQPPRTEPQPSRAEPGWTGLSDAAGVIAARQSLMQAIEDLMKPIDAYAAGPSSEGSARPADDPNARRSSSSSSSSVAATLAENADAIAAMLAATPHLYPPTTNLYDAKSDSPATLALPRIWESFDTFTAMAAASVTAARGIAEGTDPDAQRRNAANLRSACDACHAVYLRAYVPSVVTDEDKDVSFDFGN